MDTVIRVQMQDEVVFISHCTNTLGKSMNSLMSPAVSEIVSLPLFYNNGLGTKLPIKTDMLLNKETEPNPFFLQLWVNSSADEAS